MPVKFLSTCSDQCRLDCSRAPCWMDGFEKSHNARYMWTSHGGSRFNIEVEWIWLSLNRIGRRSRGPGGQDTNPRSSNIRLQPHLNTSSVRIKELIIF